MRMAKKGKKQMEGGEAATHEKKEAKKPKKGKK
jgi:hypothetical protein